MYARVARETGRAQPFLVADAGRAPRKKPPGSPSEGPTDGCEQDHGQGSAKRRQRSAARWRLSRRSRLMVPRTVGNSPERTYPREAADRSERLLEGQNPWTSSRVAFSTRRQKLVNGSRDAVLAGANGIIQCSGRSGGTPPSRGAADAWTEEPDARIGHVRICGNRG
jgi:hypothetical protein